jgi:XTP/dITP diphosphohydrolase
MSERVLVLGTRNRKKAIELIELIGPFGFRLRTLADIPNSLEVEETGRTFAENAALKACVQARHLGQWVLGEDSGLCVESLGGAPGVHSARFAGPQATDEENNRKLLAQLGDRPPAQRTAYYVCHATLADASGRVRAESEGRCCGRMRTSPSGDAGFGYDTLFEIVEFHRTFGELGNAVKSVLSHRSRALRDMIPQILRLVSSGEWST